MVKKSYIGEQGIKKVLEHLNNKVDKDRLATTQNTGLVKLDALYQDTGQTMFDNTVLSYKTFYDYKIGRDNVLTAHMEQIEANVVNIIESKVDKIDGKGLSTNDYTDSEKQKLASLVNYTHPDKHSLDMITETTDKKIMTSAERTKLEGIETGANKYTHPNSHSVNMITENSTKRFVSDAEKSTWNGKADGNHTHSKASSTSDGFMSKEHYTKLESAVKSHGSNPVHNVVVINSESELSNAPINSIIGLKG